MHQIYVNDISVDVVRKDIKNMHLAVYPPNGRVRIAVPLRIDDEAVRLFTISKLPWIRRQKRKFEEQQREAIRDFVDRESHYFFGKRYLLRIFEHDAPPKVVLKGKTYIDLFVRTGSTRVQRQNIVNEWYRKELKLAIPPLIEKWEKVIGIKVAEWGVKQMKTKWGTCNINAKRIWLNLELAKKPINCLEYILVHEMIHLHERHHNDRFLTYMEKFLPQWKFLKDELNQLPASHREWTY